MKPYLRDADLTLYQGDALEVLRELPDESVDCCVSSPPYWGLRDYGTGEWDGGDPECDHLGAPFRTKAKLNENWGEGYSDVKNAEGREPMRQTCSKCGATRVDHQLGLEETPELYVERMVEVFREVRRVLAKHGTCWVNMGDSYASNPKKGGSGTPNGRNNRGERYARGKLATEMTDAEAEEFDRQLHEALDAPRQPQPIDPSERYGDLKPKDLVMIPAQLALALRADGWYLRSEIVWAKPNPMPESVTDRPTKAHEMIYLLSKAPRYWFDQEAVREAHHPDGRLKTVHDHATPDSHPNYDNVGNGNERWPNGGRNIRSVWEIPTQPFSDAHFATFPEELVRRCILAGTSERGNCPECGAPWERVVERESAPPEVFTNRAEASKDGHVNAGYSVGGELVGGGQKLQAWRDEHPSSTTGWRPTCECCGHLHTWEDKDGFKRSHYKYAREPSAPIPGIVLDPFMGSGTTALVARKHGRHAVGIELSPDYCAMAAQRLSQLSLLTEGEAA